MTTNSNDNYSDVVERNAAYKYIADLYNKTSHGKYSGITDEEISQAVYSLKLLRFEHIQREKDQLNLELK